MPLSDSLISQFAKATNDDKKTSKETTVYGTIVEYEGSKYVKIDGSELLTPVTFTTNVEDEERVTVMIKDHTAIVTGNISSPAARTKEVETIGSKISEFETIVADKVSAEYVDANYASITMLNAETGRINTLETYNLEVADTLLAHKADIDKLEATKLSAHDADIKYASIENLQTEVANINTVMAGKVTAGEVEATYAKIKDLETANAKIENLDATYVNIDFSNIDSAWMYEFYANSGLIDNVTIKEGTITGNLVGVTIKGDVIEANTLKADRLVIRGSDGFYYALNLDAIKNSATYEPVTDEELQNGLHGSAIIAKTITADRISVTDLVSFGATIGGFKITDNSMHSIQKDSISNLMPGIYMDNEGQFVVGDANSFLKFYEDSDGTYKLDISASRILLGGGNSNRTVEDAVEELQTGIDNAQDSIDNLEVGVRNYLRNTRSMDTYYTHANGTAKIEEDSDHFGVADYTASDTRSWNNVVSSIPKIRYSQIRNKTVTFSVMLRSNDGGSWTTDDRAVFVFSLATSEMSDNLRTLYRIAMNVRDITSEWSKYSCTVTLTDEFISENRETGYENFVIDDSTLFFVQAYNYSLKHLQLKQIKLEEGNQVTTWTPAPEDADSDISDVRDIANRADDSSKVASDRLNKVELLMDQIENTIKTLVIGKDGKTLMEQTDNGWSFNFAEYQNSVSSLQSDMDLTDDDINALKDNFDNFSSEYREYIDFIIKDDKPCISLGKKDSPFRVDITNAGIDFMNGTLAPATIDHKSMKIKKAIIEEELQQGGYVWISRSSGNYGLAWKGVE